MQLEGTSRRLPIYLVLDVSGSMAGAPIEAVNAGLRDFESALKNDPHALESAYVSVVSFGSEATVLMPLTEAGAFVAPALVAGGQTALGDALAKLGRSLDADVKEKDANHPGDWKPLIFLMTDGEPTDDWRSSLAAFRARRTRRPANLIAIGCGPAVNSATLREITESVMMMQDLSPEKFKALFSWISQSARIASKSASQQATGAAPQAGAGTQLPPPPPGFVIGL